MNSDKRKVPIKNILYIFSYIWDNAENIDFKYLDNNDDFDSANILSRLFLENIKVIKKQGLYKEYIEKSEEIRGIKGKIDFKESLNNISFNNAKAFCRYDDLEENNLINQIIKTTAYRLYKSECISEENKKELNNILLLFNKVKIIDIDEKSFNIQFNRNNYYTYYMIMICKLIYESTMLSEETGKYKFIDILDDDNRMHSIFELFVYRFFCREQKEYKVYYQKTIEWNVDGGNLDIMPKMSLDTVLENKENTIIIDTKYYGNFLTKTYHGQDDVKKLISPNLYQIYAYLNNYKTKNKLRGILLYPMPYDLNEISEEYALNTNNEINKDKIRLEIRTINLTKDWFEIKQELIRIVK